MRALLRKIYEVSNRGGEPLHISALIKEVQEFVASTARSDHAGNAKGQAAVPQDLIAAVWTGKGLEKKVIMTRRAWFAHG